MATSDSTTFNAPNDGVDANSCLRFLRDPPRAHVRLPVLSLVCLRPSSLDGRFHCFTQTRLSGDSFVHLVATNVLHRLTSCLGARLQVKPPALVVIPMPSFPQAEQFLLIVIHEIPLFILHMTHSLVVVLFVNNPAYPLCICGFPLLFPCLQLLLVPSHLFLHCLGILTHPCSCLFHLFYGVVRVNTSVSMRACAFASQPHSNLSRVADRH